MVQVVGVELEATLDSLLWIELAVELLELSDETRFALLLTEDTWSELLLTGAIISELLLTDDNTVELLLTDATTSELLEEMSELETDKLDREEPEGDEPEEPPPQPVNIPPDMAKHKYRPIFVRIIKHHSLLIIRRYLSGNDSKKGGASAISRSTD